MLQDLPEFVQKQILYYLARDNFTAAKSLHDAWLKHQAINHDIKKFPEHTPKEILLSNQQASLIDEFLKSE